MEDFLECFADFYGSFSLDEIAEMLGVTPVELVTSFSDLIAENEDVIKEEMEYECGDFDEKED